MKQIKNVRFGNPVQNVFLGVGRVKLLQIKTVFFTTLSISNPISLKLKAITRTSITLVNMENTTSIHAK